jgi:hypothetical protein
MTPEDLRLECLRLAQAASIADKDSVIERASAYADFVQKGQTDNMNDGRRLAQPAADPLTNRAGIPLRAT